MYSVIGYTFYGFVHRFVLRIKESLYFNVKVEIYRLSSVSWLRR